MKRLAKQLIEKAGYRVTRIRPDESALVQAYEKGGRIPWSPEYEEAKRAFIRGCLEDPAMLERFRESGQLPGRFGHGFDERVVEYPWFFSRLSPGPGELLDAGSALNFEFILDHPLLSDKHVHILTLAPEESCFWKKGVSYLYEDLRAIPVKDRFYRTVACISTLEHVGFDNTAFTGDHRHRERSEEDFVRALAEIRRVLAPRGQLLLTVPYGRLAGFGTFRQFDENLIARVVASFEGDRIEKTYFRYDSEGWSVAEQHACVDAVYAQWANPGQRKRARSEGDVAAAARAVCCVAVTRAE